MYWLIWWMAFCMVGVWLQSWVPGVDFLLAGLIVSLQKERWLTAFWLCVVFIVIQEGIGSLAFGFSLLWYGGAVGAFFLGRILFDSDNPIFYVFFSLFLGVWHAVVLLLMTRLQGMYVSPDMVIMHSGLTVLIFPLHWAVVHKLYRSTVPSAPVHV